MQIQRISKSLPSRLSVDALGPTGDKVNMPFDLDAPCGRRLRFRDLIECGSTFLGHAERYSAGREPVPLLNLPQQEATWLALQALATEILDPVEEKFGPIRLTYGFCSPELERAIRRRAKTEGRTPRICPDLDQHAGFEIRGQRRVCERGGAAVDFDVPGVASDSLSEWMLKYTNLNRLYFFGPNRPVHVSWAAGAGRHACRMWQNPAGRWIPGRW